MLYGYIGCAITLVGIFAIPMGMSEFAKYAWFFICYSLLNAVFYTANNIAYSALTSLVTKNSAEPVSYTHLDVYKRQTMGKPPVAVNAVKFYIRKAYQIARCKE